MFMSKDKKYMFLAILILVGILIVVNSFSYAKYVSNSVWNYYLRAKGFYFTSDDLGDSTISNINNSWDGSSVHFNIRNNLNKEVMTTYDINYHTVCTITGDESEIASCHLNGTTSNEYDGILSSLDGCSNNTNDEVDVSSYDKNTCESSGYIWEKQIGVKDMYFDVVSNNGEEISDVTVNIVVTSTSPYSKTLSGEFKLHKSIIDDGKIVTNYKSNDGYGRLTISNSYLSDKCVNVSFDSSTLRSDIDINKISGYSSDIDGYLSDFNISVPSKDSLNIIFYEMDSNIVYSQSDFVVTESTGC